MSGELNTEPQGVQLWKRRTKRWELVNETVLARVLQRNRTNKMYIYMHTCYISAYLVSTKIHREGWQPGDLGGSFHQSPEAVGWLNSILLKRQW